MAIFNYLLYYLIIRPLSLLPAFLLYRLSDLLFFIFYYLVGYRKRVVYQNLRNSFPAKSEKEILKIRRAFFRHFCDLLVESLMIFNISEKQASARMKFINPELLDKPFNEGKTVIIAGGHYNNWELFAVAVDHALKHDTIEIGRAHV